MISTSSLVIQTTGRSLLSVTKAVQASVEASGISRGLCNIFIHHTSASLILSENADPTVCDDLERFMERVVIDGDPTYAHCFEGPDDMAAHIRSVLTQTSLSIPVERGRLALGTWQGLWLWEHRFSAHARRLTVTTLG
jgi:secondary thiamine-phosphate synthase enzyme